MGNRYIIVDGPNGLSKYWRSTPATAPWTPNRSQAQLYSQAERNEMTLPEGGCWLLIDETTQAAIEEEAMRPRLLKEIAVENEQLIYETLRELRTIFPSYRDDQLFTFWLGRLAAKGIDVHDFDSTVSFKS